MVGKSTHLQVIPRQSTQNTANLPLQTYEKNQWTFLLFNVGVDFIYFKKIRNYIIAVVRSLFVVLLQGCLSVLVVVLYGQPYLVIF